MARRSRDIQQIMDRAAIHDLHTRYFQGLDRGSPEQVRSCFTQDARCHYDKRTPTEGIEALMGSLQFFNRLKSGSMKITTHFMGNFNLLRLESDTAETEVNAIAFLVEPKNGVDQIAMRSLRYLDRLRHEQDGWKVSHRIHTLDWSCALPANFALELAQRISALPRN
jgi:hypothetical protein